MAGHNISIIISTAMGNTMQSLNGLASTLGKLKGLALTAFGVAGISEFAQKALEASANMEFLKKGLQFNLGKQLGGNMQAAEEATERLVREMQKLGEASAYDSNQLIPLARSWVNIGDNADTAIKKMKTIVDAASAYGMTEEAMGRMNLALTQMQMKGKIQAEEMLQLTEAGVPAWEMLSEAMGLSVQQLQDMSRQAKLGKDAMDKLFVGMEQKTSGMAKTLGDTLRGKYANIREAIENSFANIGDLISKYFDVPATLDSVGEMAEGFSGFFRNVKENAKSMGVKDAIIQELKGIDPAIGDLGIAFMTAFNAIKETVSAATGFIGEHKEAVKTLVTFVVAAAGVSAMVKAWGAVTTAIGAATTAATGFSLALNAIKLNPFMLAITLAITALVEIQRHWDDIRKAAEHPVDFVYRIINGRNDILEKEMNETSRGGVERADWMDKHGMTQDNPAVFKSTYQMNTGAYADKLRADEEAKKASEEAKKAAEEQAKAEEEAQKEAEARAAIDAEVAGKVKKIKEETAGIQKQTEMLGEKMLTPMQSLEKRIQEIQKEEEAWLQGAEGQAASEAEKAAVTERTTAKIILEQQKLAVEGHKAAESMKQDTEAIRFAMEHSSGSLADATAKQIHSIEQWKKANLDKARSAEETRAVIENAAAKEAQAYQDAAKKAKDATESIQDKLFKLTHTEKENQVYDLLKEANAAMMQGADPTLVKEYVDAYAKKNKLAIPKKAASEEDYVEVLRGNQRGWKGRDGDAQFYSTNPASGKGNIPLQRYLEAMESGNPMQYLGNAEREQTSKYMQTAAQMIGDSGASMQNAGQMMLNAGEAMTNAAQTMADSSASNAQQYSNPQGQQSGQQKPTSLTIQGTTVNVNNPVTVTEESIRQQTEQGISDAMDKVRAQVNSQLSLGYST